MTALLGGLAVAAVGIAAGLTGGLALVVMDGAFAASTLLSAALGGGETDKEGIQIENGKYDDWYDTYEHQKRPVKGKQFRGGSRKSHDKWYGINDKNFQKWWERVGKGEWGGEDIQDSKMAQEIYNYWKDIGSPNANGGKWK